MQNKKTTLTVLAIIALFLILGILCNLAWNYMDRLTHPQAHHELISQYAEQYAIPEEIVYAVIKTESDFDVRAYSSAGAMGLMQMMPVTFEWLTGEEHLDENLPSDALYEPDVSIRYGVYYLRYLRNKFGENWTLVLAAYNAGEGNVVRWLNDSEYSDGQGGLSSIPFEETRNYVERVNHAKEIYYKLYYTEK